MEVSGRDNQTRQTRATTRRHNEQAKKTVRSNQTNTKGRPCPYYLRSRIQEKTESMRTSTTSKSTAYLAAYSAEEASVSSGTQNNPPSNEQSSTTETVSFNDILLMVTGTWHSAYESPTRIRLQAKPGLVGKHHTSPLLRCPQCMLSTPG
ncbi:uncharacterized protein TNCV_2750421 [Trichonephila clavipes]|nr:uncharacterized protein TNCV_2750421 [Trichonephila clavipes]